MGEFYNGGLWENTLPVVGFKYVFALEFVLNLLMIQPSFSLIVRDVINVSQHVNMFDIDLFHFSNVLKTEITKIRIVRTCS